jgi:hypothetical protein
MVFVYILNFLKLVHGFNGNIFKVYMFFVLRCALACIRISGLLLFSCIFSACVFMCIV